MDDIDLARLGGLRDLMGDAALLALAGQLADGLAALALVPAAARADHLHRLQGGAASLGFSGLAAALAAALADAPHGDIGSLVTAAPGIAARMDAALHALSCQR